MAPTPPRQPNSSKPTDAREHAAKNAPDYTGAQRPRPHDARPAAPHAPPSTVDGKAPREERGEEDVDAAAEDLYDNVACTD